MSFKVPEKYRQTRGLHGTREKDGNNGAFFIPINGKNVPLKVIASDGMEWEHVSVSLPNRTPTWSEMQQVKELFWDDTDTVIQYHVPAEHHVNAHQYCLHMWRPVNKEIPMPNEIMV